MRQQSFVINYAELQSVAELSDSDKELVDAAINAAKSAYAPYSGFCVGCALRLDNEKVIAGSNQENAAYPSGMCAERVAMFWAGARFPEAKIVNMVIVAIKDGEITRHAITPCGGCRQVFIETVHRQNHTYPVILVGKESIIKLNSVLDFSPFIFSPDDLNDK